MVIDDVAPSLPLLKVHEAAGASMTTFAGWQVPLRFSSELAEHRAVREAAGLFDLSHMGQVEVNGADAGALLDYSMVSELSNLHVGRARYTLIVAEDGGVLDDLITYRLADDDFLVVPNAANRLRVGEELTRRGQNLAATVTDRTEERALLAVQGPAAVTVLRDAGLEEHTDLRPFRVTTMHLSTNEAEVPLLVARTGYTGEDGFEISVPAAAAEQVWQQVLAAGRPHGLEPCGLASRDSLRLEAAMPLYGAELSTERRPQQAGLARLVHLREGHDFVGRHTLATTKDDAEVLVGLAGQGRRAARGGDFLYEGDQWVGTITSGALSPTLGYPIALAYVSPQHSEIGQQLQAEVRGRRFGMEVVPTPFYRRE